MKLRDLESALTEVKVFQNPVVELEQYPTSPHIAAQFIHTAESSFQDIQEKAVCDLGCGTGMLSLAAVLLGAGYVLGVDVDESALELARENVQDMDMEGSIDFCKADVAESEFMHAVGSHRRFDTVITNPPFGTKRKGVDIAFLIAAVQLSKGAVYSMHKTTTRDYIYKKATGWGARPQILAQLKFDIGHAFRFHRLSSVDIAVDLWRLDVSTVPDDLHIELPALQPPDDLQDVRRGGRQKSRSQSKRTAQQASRKQRGRR